MPLEQLSDMVSFVTQDNFLFRCSILENIRIGRPDATDEEVKRPSAILWLVFMMRTEVKLKSADIM